MEYTLITKKKDDTVALGKLISSYFERGDVVLLEGDLGAGKTTFTSGVAQGLNINEGVRSPTFNIMKCYFNGKIPMYHIDAYRLENQNIEIGLDEYIEGDGVCLIEWPRYIEPLLPDELLEIEIRNIGDDNRQITLKSNTEHFDKLIKNVQEATK